MLSSIDWDLLEKLAVILPIAATVLGLAFKYGYRPLRRRVGAANQFYHRVNTGLETIEREFKPNGGDSMRDAINRIQIALYYERGVRRATANALNTAIYETDAAGSFVWINRRWSEITGLTREQSNGSGWCVAVCEHQRDCVLEDWEDSVKQRRLFRRTVCLENIHNRAVTHAEMTGWPISDERAQVIGYTGFLTPTDACSCEVKH